MHGPKVLGKKAPKQYHGLVHVTDLLPTLYAVAAGKDKDLPRRLCVHDLLVCLGCEDSSVVERRGLVIERARVRVPDRSRGRFSSPGSTFCADCYFGIRSTLVVNAVACKIFIRSAKNAGGRLQLNTHAPYVCVFE